MDRAKDTKQALFQKVRWLTINEIAALWAPELGIPVSVVERELQLSVLNLPRWRAGERLIPEFPAGELPSVDTRMDRADIDDFCEKQSPWPRPQFWFPESARGPSFPGRPSIMGAILQHLGNLNTANKLEPTIAAQARVLAAWAKQAIPSTPANPVQFPTAHSIENGIRDEFNLMKRNPH